MKKIVLSLSLLLAPPVFAQLPAGCFNASSTWWTNKLTTAIGAAGGTVIAQVAPPNVTSDTVIGLAQIQPTFFPDMAAIVRFENGSIQAMSGGTSTATDVYVDANPKIPYVVPPAGQYYLVTFKIDPLGQGTYSALITPPGGTQQLLASGLKFRSTAKGMPTLSSLSYAGGATGNGTAVICNIQTVVPPPPSTVTYNGSAPFTAQGNVPYTLQQNLTGCTSTINVLNVVLNCPPLTGTIPWTTSGSAPFSTTFNFTGLPPGCVPSLSGTTISFTGCAPIQPAIASCTIAAGNHSVTLNWTPSVSAGVSGVNVYRGTVSGGPYHVIASSVQGTQYIDSGVTSGSTYFYVTTAVNANGESSYSNQATAVIP